MQRVALFVTIVLAFAPFASAEDRSAATGPGAVAVSDLIVLGASPEGVPPGEQLQHYLKGLFQEQVARREAAFAALRSRADCERWQRERREFFIEQLGGWPERTPLNAQVVGRLEGQGYRVEKVLFESRPGHHVTGNVYLPDATAYPPPWPGVLVPCGHSHNGKAADGYQRMSMLLARHGMAAFCYDPIGQGERYQMLDFEREHEVFEGVGSRLPVPHPRVRYLCTQEHTAMGLGCILLGSNVAQYRIWDGMRAIDYLQSRPDIRADRIGCTGNSGGGTLTAYLMALDDRIVAAAPACYLTTFSRLIATRGPQDAEQNIFGQIAFGMDEADYVLMRAPKPTLICAGRRDVTFDIDGTWELFRQSKEFYARIGFPERVEINDADLPHGFYLQQREAAARWLHRWLLGQDQVIQEVDPAALPDPLTDEALRAMKGDWTDQDLACTPHGQVLLMEGEKSVFQLNSERERELRTERTARWASLTDTARREVVRRVLHPEPGGVSAGTAPHRADRDPPICVAVGTVPRDGYTIEKLVLTPEPGLRLPALLFLPAEPRGAATLYLHGDDLHADAGPGGPIEALVRQGQTVLAAELRGICETETGRGKRDYGYGKFGPDVQDIYLAYLCGRSYVGMRTDDVADWTNVLRDRLRGDAASGGVHLVAIGEAAIPALHAAALDPDRYTSVRLQRMLPSWVEIVQATDNQNQLVSVVHGALRHYDLPDLIDLAGRSKVTLSEPVNALGIALTQP